MRLGVHRKASVDGSFFMAGGVLVQALGQLAYGSLVYRQARFFFFP